LIVSVLAVLVTLVDAEVLPPASVLVIKVLPLGCKGSLVKEKYPLASAVTDFSSPSGKIALTLELGSAKPVTVTEPSPAVERLAELGAFGAVLSAELPPPPQAVSNAVDNTRAAIFLMLTEIIISSPLNQINPNTSLIRIYRTNVF
jgi:hypothetical protein